MRYINNKELAAKVKPAARGQSDKYSWRLHQHILKAHPYQLEVWIKAWNQLEGHNTDAIKLWHASKAMPCAGLLMIGAMDCDYEDQGLWFHGKSVAQICQHGRERHGWAYGPAHYTSEWIEITDWFWKQYIDKGRCTFYPAEHHWQQINTNARKCAYCGQHQHRTVRTEHVSKRVEIWTPEAAH